MTWQTIQSRLSAVYEKGEARAVARQLLEEGFGLTYTDIACGAVEQLSPAEQQQLEASMQRLEQGEPVQYVLGKAWFRGICLHVEPGVLIPRPETAELIDIISNTMPKEERQQVLDIGTGSGCIAISLKAVCPMAEVTAWDISDKALTIASGNAEALNAEVTFSKHDILTESLPSEPQWDIIVSNPPYICDSERKDMHRNVLDHEPGLALFVPDADPLLFYRTIAEYARKGLKPGGKLYFEINAAYGQETADMLRQKGYHDIMIHKDQFGRDRFVSALLC